MGLSYLHYRQPAELVGVKKPEGKLQLLESDPLPLHVDHLRALIAGSKAALAAILDLPQAQLGRIRFSAEPICGVVPDVLVEAGKRLEIVEVMAERPRGLTRARRFDKALGTDRLQSDGLRDALTAAGFEDVPARTSGVTLVAPDFTPAQLSAALRLGFRLRRLVLASLEGSGDIYVIIGGSKEDYPTEVHSSVEDRKKLAHTISDEVRRFLAATEWVVADPEESLVRASLTMPGRGEPIDLVVRPLIVTAKDSSPGLLVELSVKEGTKAVDPKRIELGWGPDLPERSDGFRFWRTSVSLDGGLEHAIPRLLFPVREVHDAVESARLP